MSSNARAWADKDCESLEVVEATKGERSWDIKRSDGWSFGGITIADAEAAGITEIKAGDRATFWPRGIGQVVRGAAINGVVVYYRTTWEQHAKQDQELADSRERDQAKLEKEKAGRDARWAALPDCLRARFDRFNEGNPYWRRDFEGYELMVCEQAHALSQHLGSREKYEEWKRDGGESFPGMDGGHSGNSWGMTKRLAWWLLTAPENATREHGALCNLVGCKEYGDTGKEPAAVSS